MDENILDSVKTYLGIAADELGFDAEILMLINSAFSTLADVNISAMPTTMVTDNTLEWSAVPMDDGQLGNVKLYVFIEVKLAFDPPQLPAVLSSFSERKQELVWRINERAENAK